MSKSRFREASRCAGAAREEVEEGEVLGCGIERDGNKEAAMLAGVVGNKVVAVVVARFEAGGSFNTMKFEPRFPTTKGDVDPDVLIGMVVGVTSVGVVTSDGGTVRERGAVSEAVVVTGAASSSVSSLDLPFPFPPALPHLQLTSHRLALNPSFSFSRPLSRIFSRP